MFFDCKGEFGDYINNGCYLNVGLLKHAWFLLTRCQGPIRNEFKRLMF